MIPQECAKSNERAANQTTLPSRELNRGAFVCAQNLFNAQLGLIAIYILLTIWFVLIKEKSIFFKAISVVLPEQVWCRTGTIKVFCNSGLPLNAHYQVFLSWYYLTIFTQHTLKGNLYHKLWNTLLTVLWMKRLWLPKSTDHESVRCFLQVVWNHDSDFAKCSLGTWVKTGAGHEAVSARAAIPLSPSA